MWRYEKRNQKPLVQQIEYLFNRNHETLQERDREWVIKNEKLNAIFKGCKKNSFPPVNGLFNIKIIVDPEVLDMDEIYIHSGDPEKLLQLDKIAVNLLFKD